MVGREAKTFGYLCDELLAARYSDEFLSAVERRHGRQPVRVDR